jgi:hypothetical protein
MVDLLDFLSDGLLSGLGPSSARGTLTVVLLLTLALAGVNGWVLFAFAQPLQEPAWAIGTIIGGILFGGAGAFLSGIHLARHQEETALAWAMLISSLASVAFAIAAAA